jgi:hypothetical protein
VKDALIAGLISGIISPLIVSLIQHKVIWKRQKTLEIKYSLFNDAVRALSQLSTDALDLALQSQKPESNGVSTTVHFRPETKELIEKSRGLVMAFFSQQTSRAYEDALATRISVDDIPCLEFEKNRTLAIVLLAKELGIR